MAVAEFAHQRLAGMGQRFQPRQSEETAGALDRVNEAENVVENLRVVRILLELDQLNVHEVEALGGLGQEFAEKIVHETWPQKHTESP